MVKKRKNVLISSAQVVDSPMKEPRIIRGNHLEKARNSLNEALYIISKKEQKKKLSLQQKMMGENDTNKKLKKNEAKQEVKDSLVLKLRDRSIDLASFTNNTAMYPICRAWIKNDPLSARQMKGKKSENLEHSFKSENESSTVEDYVYKLPPPKDKSEVRLNINHRTPTNLPKDVVTTLDTKINNDEIPNLNELLNEHRKRWACVRQEWIKFSNENKARYTMSKSILNSMLNKTAYNRTMEKQPDKPEDVTNDPLPSMSEPMEVQDAVASTLAMLFPQPIIAASKSKAQKQREYRQRIAASRTPAQVAAARKSKNERQRNNRLRQAANLAIASGSHETTTTSSSRSGEESNNVQTRSQRQHALQQSITTADQPDERVNLTNEPLFPAIPVPMEVQEAVAFTSATPFAEPITAAPKTRAQIQREYRQRIAASKTPAQAAAAREARNVRDRNNRLRHAANLVIASGSLEATTTSSSRSGQRLTTVHIDTQRQFT